MNPLTSGKLARQYRDRRILQATLANPASIVVLGTGQNPVARGYIAALLSHMLVLHRGERVLAIDADLPGSPLTRWMADPRRTSPENPAAQADSLNPVLAALGIARRGSQPDQAMTYSWLRSRLMSQSPVPLLATNPAQPGLALNEPEYLTAVTELQRWFPLLVVNLPDFAPQSITNAAVRYADHIVVVGDDTAHGHTAVQQTCDQLWSQLGWSADFTVTVALQTDRPQKKPGLDSLRQRVRPVSVPRHSPQAPASPTELVWSGESGYAAMQHLAALCLASVVENSTVEAQEEFHHNKTVHHEKGTPWGQPSSPSPITR